jgi:type II secretory pathway pseudopilin PulG
MAPYDFDYIIMSAHNEQPTGTPVQKNRHRRGIALLEVMIAVGILTFAVSAITSSIVAGQQQSMEARNKIVGSVAAESLLSQVSQESWDLIDSWHGYFEAVGTLTDPTGAPIYGEWERIGRKVTVVEAEVQVTPLEVFIIGRTVTVTSFTKDGRILSAIERFVPEPQS